jgi:hypothetical protein
MNIEPRNRIPAPPIHPLAALATIALDGFFSVFEVLDPLMLLFISSGIGLVGFLTTTFVQRYLARDEWGPAIAKGLVMGTFAGVPYPVAGTVIGAPLLVWAGVHQWIKLPGKDNNQIVDGKLKDTPILEDKKEEDNENQSR